MFLQDENNQPKSNNEFMCYVTENIKLEFDFENGRPENKFCLQRDVENIVTPLEGVFDKTQILELLNLCNSEKKWYDVSLLSAIYAEMLAHDGFNFAHISKREWETCHGEYNKYDVKLCKDSEMSESNWLYTFSNIFNDIEINCYGLTFSANELEEEIKKHFINHRWITVSAYASVMAVMENDDYAYIYID